MAAKKGVVIVISGDDKSGAVLDQVEKHLTEVREHAEAAEESMGAFGAMADRVIERIGIYMAADAIIDGMKGLIEKSIDLGEEMGHLAQQTGISTENLSVLKYAAEKTGVSFDTFTKGFKKLGESLFEFQQNSVTYVRAFALLGIGQKEITATGGDMYKVLELVANKMSQMPDGWKKSAAATEIFGRAGVELIPVLNQGAAGVESFKSEAEDLGLVIDSQTVEKMEKLREKTAEIKGAFSGLSLELASDLEPALAKLARILTSGAKNVREYLGAFGTSPTKAIKMAFWADLAGITPGRLGKYFESLAVSDMQQIDDMQDAAHPKDKGKPKGSGAPRLIDPKYQAALEKWQNAKRQLMEAAAKLDLEHQKTASEAMLAELDSAHKQSLISDAQYYARKKQIQDDAIAAEEADVNRQKAAIETQAAEILNGKKAASAAERKKQEADLMGLQTRELALDGQLLKLDEQRKKVNADIAADVDQSLQKMKQQSADLSAQLERLQGSGTAKQLEAAHVSYQDKRKKLATEYGKNSPEVQELDAIQKLEDAKLRLAAIDQQIATIRTNEKIQELQLEDGLLNRRISEAEYAREMQTLRGRELGQLRDLQGEYNHLADAAGRYGDDAKVKMQESIDGIEESMQKLKTNYAQTLEPILEALESHPKKWSDAFREAANDIQRDMMRLANQRLMRAMGLDGGERLGSGGLSAGRSGISGLSGLGGIFDKLFHRSGKASNGGLATGAGTIADGAVAALKQGRGAGAGSGVVVNVINQGTAQEVSSSGSSGGNGLEQRVITIVMKDADTLGPMSKALGGAISMIKG